MRDLVSGSRLGVLAARGLPPIFAASIGSLLMGECNLQERERCRWRRSRVSGGNKAPTEIDVVMDCWRRAMTLGDVATNCTERDVTVSCNTVTVTLNTEKSESR